MSSSNEDPLFFTFFTEIGIIEQLAHTQLERVLPDGLRMSHFGVLNHLARLNNEQSPAVLAKAFQVTKGAMTNTISRLETRGLVDVKPDPKDGRAKLISLTGKGRRVREDCIKATKPLFADIGQRISSKEFARALPFLQTLRTDLDKTR